MIYLLPYQFNKTTNHYFRKILFYPGLKCIINKRSDNLFTYYTYADCLEFSSLENAMKFADEDNKHYIFLKEAPSEERVEKLRLLF